MAEGALFLVSVLAGVVGAMTGVGGGVVLLPALTLAGVDIKHAIALNVLSTISVSSGAASTYVRGHITNLRVGGFLEVFGVCGALLGASLAVIAPRGPLFVASGLLLLLVGAALWTRQERAWQRQEPHDTWAQRLSWRSSYYDAVERRTIAYAGRRAKLAGALMVGAGVVAGLLGIGSSAFTVLIQELTIGLPPKVSIATSNLIISVMAVAGACVYLEARLIDPHLAVPVIVGVVLGAMLGARLFVHAANREVQRMFLVVLMVIGVEMIFHAGRVR